jgi:UDP-N-acetylmuramoylalanine--D-glutamate ligase
MNIAVAGYALEGKSNFRYFSRLGHSITILDERTSLEDVPSGTPTRLGDEAFKDLHDFDMVVRTASMSPVKLRDAKKVWSATNEFFEKCPALVIGVTGTKGKGTTVSLIASILRQAGKTVHIVGNIGTPPLDELANISDEDIVVYELSSFQLWDIEKSPRIAVVLMIEPDHLDVHADFGEYVAAKQNIVRYQREADTVIYTKDNQYAATIATSSRASKIPVQSKETAHVSDGAFWYGEQKLCSTDALRLSGAHNEHNACVAIAAAWQFVKDGSMIERGLHDFAGLPHRLKHVRTVKGVAYCDDSIATTVGSAIAAIDAFEQPKIIILGGSSKGVVDFDELAEKAARGGVKRALLIGDQADHIRKSFIKFGLRTDSFDSSFSMQDIVRFASDIAAPGDVVILSPACASFGLFKNYADRGDQFIEAVKAL